MLRHCRVIVETTERFPPVRGHGIGAPLGGYLCVCVRKTVRSNAEMNPLDLDCRRFGWRKGEKLLDFLLLITIRATRRETK